jgi:hypothetical protein
MENNKREPMSNPEYIEEEITFKELGRRCGIEDLDTPEIYDIAAAGRSLRNGVRCREGAH